MEEVGRPTKAGASSAWSAGEAVGSPGVGSSMGGIDGLSDLA